MQVFNNNSNIELVLTDIIMPAMNGRELCAELRKKNEKQKIIFMSGFINEELNKFGFFYSEKYFIEKPFSPNFLLKKIRTVLNEI